jgi:hypothetical protein
MDLILSLLLHSHSEHTNIKGIFLFYRKRKFSINFDFNFSDLLVIENILKNKIGQEKKNALESQSISSVQ